VKPNLGRILLLAVAGFLVLSVIVSLYRPPAESHNLAGVYQAVVYGVFLMTGSAALWARSESGSWRYVPETLGLVRAISWLPIGLGAAAGLVVGLLSWQLGDHTVTDAIPLAAAVPVFLVTAFNEEVFARGALLRVLGMWQAAVFGFLHLESQGLIGVAIATVAGYLLGVVRQKSSLWSAIGAHAAFNLVQFFVIRALAGQP
jgi:membrane protease YdiL (CAAX protease family)